MGDTKANGLLSIEVKAPPIVAGTPATVSLIIRNPFDQEVIVESIQAPSSAPLLPEHTEQDGQITRTEDHPNALARMSAAVTGLLAGLGKVRMKEIIVGPLTAEFPAERGRSFHLNMEPNSKVTFREQLGPQDHVHINNAEGAEVLFDSSSTPSPTGTDSPTKSRVIAAHQEDLASFELKTARWLLVKPKTLDLFTLVRFRIGTEQRSQVVPVNLAIQPPVKAIILGTVSGGILGWLARQLNKGGFQAGFSWVTLTISVLGVIVMGTILAIVLSRQESSKGFVTLEDFYGAFVVGAILGYTGTQYFESSIQPSIAHTGA